MKKEPSVIPKDLPSTNEHIPRHKCGNPRLALLVSLPFLFFPSNANATIRSTSHSLPPSAVQATELPEPQSIRYDGGTFTCSFEGNRMHLTFEKPGEEPQSLEPDTVSLDRLGRVYETICGAERSVIVSENYITISLGARDLAAGRNTLVREDGQEAFYNSYSLEMPEGAGAPEEIFIEGGALFLRYDDNSLRALQLGNFSTRLFKLDEVDGANSSSVLMKAMGMLFFIQPGGVPVSVVGIVDGHLENQAFDAPEGVELRSLVSVEMTADGIRAVFDTPDGQKVLNVSAEEGSLDSVGVSAR